MHRLAALAALALLAPIGVRAEEKPQPLTWHHEGYARLLDAAAEAKAKGRRLLIGLSGGPT
jgi:hypothetical protein